MFMFICLLYKQKNGISEVTAKILITPLDSPTIFPEKAEYLNDRKALTTELWRFSFFQNGGRPAAAILNFVTGQK